MPIHNADIASVFDEIADLLEIQGANVFRVRAYRNAARSLGDLSQEVSAMVAANEDLTGLPGVGQARRGWLEKNDVLNTRSLRELKPLLKRMKS
jgi:DNA polymerase (family 10)